jgi:hypothetical protein
LAVELVLVADVFALAPCVFVDCIVDLVSFARSTEADPAKELGKTLPIGTRFTEIVPAEEFGKMLLIGTRSTKNLVLSFSWLATTM